jgi:hypothetical protein
VTPEERFAAILEEFRGRAGITLPSGGPGQKMSFGSSGLRFKGKVFAMLSSDREFVVKLPRERVDALVRQGDGKRFDPRRNGHVMKEWIVMKLGSKANWLELATEAKEFVIK